MDGMHSSSSTRIMGDWVPFVPDLSGGKVSYGTWGWDKDLLVPSVPNIYQLTKDYPDGTLFHLDREAAYNEAGVKANGQLLHPIDHMDIFARTQVEFLKACRQAAPKGKFTCWWSSKWIAGFLKKHTQEEMLDWFELWIPVISHLDAICIAMYPSELGKEVDHDRLKSTIELFRKHMPSGMPLYVMYNEGTRGHSWGDIQDEWNEIQEFGVDAIIWWTPAAQTSMAWWKELILYTQHKFRK